MRGAVEIYVVRMIEDKQIVGMFTPVGMEHLEMMVEEVCDPCECEYAVVEELCLTWPGKAPSVPCSAGEPGEAFDCPSIGEEMDEDLEEAEWFPLVSDSWVYFAKAGNRVKIGRARDVRKRTQALQTGCPERIEIVKVLSGGKGCEASLHRQFAAQRVGGEWFELAGDLATYLGAP